MTEIDYTNLFGNELRGYNEEGEFVQTLQAVIEYTFDRLQDNGNNTPDDSDMYDTLWEELDEEVSFRCDSEGVIVDYGLSNSIDEYKDFANELGFTDNDIDLDKIAFAVLYRNLPSVDDLLEEYARLYGEEEEEEE